MNNTNANTPLLIPAGAPLEPGKMYLRLCHGRRNPEQQMDDWGFVGPCFGPLVYYVHTYCATFRIHGENATELWLEKYDDMICWDGCYYGDMEVFVAGAPEKAAPASLPTRLDPESECLDHLEYAHVDLHGTRCPAQPGRTAMVDHLLELGLRQLTTAIAKSGRKED